MNDNINPVQSNSDGFESPITGSRVTSPLPETRAWTVPAPAPTPAKRRSGFLPSMLLVGMLLLGMIFGGAGAGAAMLVAGKTSAAPAVTVPAPATGSTASDTSPVNLVEANTITNIYQKVSPSIVRIESTITSGTGRRQSSGTATGTGIVVDKEGHILTNNHVIAGATSVKITMTDGSEYSATVVGTAPQDDLAVIKADAPADKLTPVELGDSSTVQTGDAVIAIGYPFGLDQSLTSGIVSGLNRDSASASSRTMTGLIQVDAAINPGNSGGPLLNAAGQVIGINTMIESPIEAFTGIGLAVPINRAKTLLPQLQQGGEVQRPWIGISGTELDASVQQQLGLSVDAGILVMDVTAGGPGELAGLVGSDITTDQQTGSVTTNSVGDIITAIDGQKVGSVAELTSYLDGKQPGDKVTLSIIRDGKAQDVTITLQAWPSNLSTEN